MAEKRVKPVRRLSPDVIRSTLIDIENARATGRKWVEEFSETMARLQPSVDRYQAQFDRAVKGDDEALVRLFTDNGIAMLEDEPIRERIDELRYAEHPNRDVLNRLAKAIRTSLLAPRRPGRRSGTSLELVRCIPSIQRAFDTRSVRLKKTYRNLASRQLDVAAISKHVAAAVPPQFRVHIARATATVLDRKPAVTKGFGIDVVAESLSRSPRWIRSTQKRKRQ